MTEKDLEINELRRENAKLSKENKELKEMHMLDMAEIAFLRRQVDFLMEGEPISNEIKQ